MPLYTVYNIHTRSGKIKFVYNIINIMLENYFHTIGMWIVGVSISKLIYNIYIQYEYILI